MSPDSPASLVCSPSVPPPFPLPLGVRYTRYSVQTSDGWLLALHAFLPEEPIFSTPLLCIHGFSQSHLTWTAGGFAQQIAAAGAPVYVLDLRGHADSQRETMVEALREGWNTDAYSLFDVPAAMALIRERHPGMPMILCGHSMGGVIAVATAIRLRQEGIAGVVSIAAPLDPAQVGKRLLIAGKNFLRVWPILKRTRVPFHALPMSRFFSLMDSVYYSRQPKLGRLLPHVTPRDPMQVVPRLWHPEHIDESIVSTILQNSYHEPLGVVLEWCEWMKAGSIMIGHPAAVDYTKLFHRLTIPVVAAWGEDDFLAPPRVGGHFQRSVRSNWSSFLSLPRTHHIDITAGSPAQLIVHDVIRLLQVVA